MKKIMKKLILCFATVSMVFTSMFSNVVLPVHAASEKTFFEVNKADEVINEAKKHLGKPYVWGAEGPNSFDCSGYVSYVLKKTGLSLGADRITTDSAMAFLNGKGVTAYTYPSNQSNPKNAKKGDLVFYFGDNGETIHMGIYMGDGKIIHCAYNMPSGPQQQVMISDVDSLGSKHGTTIVSYKVYRVFPDSGGMTIKKVNERGEPLAGVKFEITKPDGTKQTVTTGSNGLWDSDVAKVDLDEGTYKVKEISTIEGYLLDSTVKTVKVEAGKKANANVVSFTNKEPTGEISLKKYNEDKSKALADTQFHVTSNVGYDEYVTTDSNGEIHLTGLKLGTYTFVETKAPNGYLLDSKPIVVKLEYKDQHTSVIYADVEAINTTPTGEITLTKFNDDKSQVLQGTKFHITSNVGFEKDVVTDSNGKIHLTGLKLGTYTFVETQASNGYLINRNPIVIELKYKDQHTSVIYGNIEATNDTPTGKIILTKYNDDKSATIAGTQYRLTGPNGYNKVHSTNSDGKLIVEDLQLGDYTLVEVKASEGYLLNNQPINISLTYKDQETSVIVGTAEQTNTEPTATVHLKKEDKETGSTPQGDATLKGAVYELVAAEDIYNKAKTHKFYSKGDVVATRITDEKGNMQSVTDLPLGFYQLKETKPSNGYLLDKTVYDIRCDYEGQDVEVVVREATSLETVKKQAFQIIKISTDEGGEVVKLPSAEFTVKLTSEVAKVGWDKAKTYNILTTDDKGYAKSIELPYGTYTVRETKVPDNVMPVEDFTVIIDEDNREPQTWRIMNDAPFKALIKAVKLDKETGKTVLLPDTTFKIKNLKTNEYVGQWVWFPIPHYVDTFKTDESGTFTTPDTLEVGEYQLEEIHAPYGYVVDKTPIKFTVSSNTMYQIAEDGKTPIITVTKEDVSVKGKINVQKIGEQLVDIEKDEEGNIQFIYESLPVDGAQFVIKAAEDIYSADNQKDIIYKKGQTVAELTTKKGSATTKQLPLGKYKVYEVIAGDGFVLNKEVKEVELTYKDENTSVVSTSTEYENKRQTVDLSVFKRDKDTDTPLKGAMFGLYAKEDIYTCANIPSRALCEVLVEEGELIEVAVSDEEGIAKFVADLPIGFEFEIREIKAPIGYSSSDEVIDINTFYQGQDTEKIEIVHDFFNEITKVEISKKDITTGNELPGAHMVVKEKDGPVFESWISSDKPHMIKGLEPGKTYELIETSSPYGFALAEKIEFIVKDTGEVQQIEMKDEHVKGNLKWNKTGEAFTDTILGQNEFGQTVSPIWKEQNLLNAEITIYAAEDITLGNGVTYWHKDEAIQTLASDYEDVISKDLLVGHYYYVESSDLHGYITDTQKHYFEIEDSQSTEIQVVESTLENKRPSVDVKFTKYMESLKEHEELNAWKDVVFGIYAREDIYDYMGNVAIENGTLIDTTGIDELGQFDHFPDLPNGVYYVKELQTNKMYNLDPTEYDFEIAWHGGDVTSYTINIGSDDGIINELQHGKIVIHKTDLDTKEVLKDVEFMLATDKEFSNIIRTVNTDENGIALFDELELGTYFIKESPNAGYVTNTHIYEVEITKDGDELTIDIENKPVEMEFSKVDITDNEELPGAKLTVTDKETGKVIDEWISTNEPHKIKYLVEGREYVLTEITAPDGYEIAESITFKAEDGVKITMKDKLTPPRETPPNTGDTAHTIEYLILSGVSLLALIVLGIIKKEEKEMNRK